MSQQEEALRALVKLTTAPGRFVHLSKLLSECRDADTTWQALDQQYAGMADYGVVTRLPMKAARFDGLTWTASDGRRGYFRDRVTRMPVGQPEQFTPQAGLEAIECFSPVS